MIHLSLRDSAKTCCRKKSARRHLYRANTSSTRLTASAVVRHMHTKEQTKPTHIWPFHHDAPALLFSAALRSSLALSSFLAPVQRSFTPHALTRYLKTCLLTRLHPLLRVFATLPCAEQLVRPLQRLMPPNTPIHAPRTTQYRMQRAWTSFSTTFMSSLALETFFARSTHSFTQHALIRHV